MRRFISLRPFKGSSKLLLIAALFLALTVMAVAARKGLSPLSNESTTRPTASRPFIRARPASAGIEAETVTVTSGGMEPSEITRPTGRFILALENRSDFPQLTFRLNDDTGQTVLEIAMPDGQSNWNGEIDLPDGHYTLTAADHAGWACQLTLTE
jgi:hypothetical protein